MKINYNMSAIIANNQLLQSEDSLSKSTERLSTGYKINHAKDSPSGIAIAKKMNAQIRGLSSASQNASDGISVVETAEGALTEIHDMLQRMNELAIKSANGTMTDSDREAIQKEVNQLTEEIERISRDTEFSGRSLLDGTFDLKGYVESSNQSAASVEYYSDETAVGYYNVVATLKTEMDAEGTTITVVDTATLDNTVNPITLANGQEVDLQEVQNITSHVDDDGRTVTLKGDNHFELTLVIDTESYVSGEDITVNLTGIGDMRVQIGANEGQILELRIPTVSAKTLGIEDADVTTAADAKKAIDKVAGAISGISSIRSRLGAYQNRLEHSVSSLDVTNENMTSAYSRIMDVNMAEEMTEYTKNQVLTQAGTSMVAQANERPSQVLQLLQ